MLCLFCNTIILNVLTWRPMDTSPDKFDDCRIFSGYIRTYLNSYFIEHNSFLTCALQCHCRQIFVDIHDLVLKISMCNLNCCIKVFSRFKNIRILPFRKAVPIKVPTCSVRVLDYLPLHQD